VPECAGRVFECPGVAAAHDGQRAVLRARLAARHGRIDEMQATFSCKRVEFACDVGRCRCVIDEHGARCHPGKCALVSEHDTAQVFVVANACEYEIGTACGIAWRGGRAATVFGRPLGSLRRSAVIDRHVEAGFRQMPGHGIAHDAEAEKRDACDTLRCAAVRIRG